MERVDKPNKDNGPPQRNHATANRLAALLYGVIGIMTADVEANGERLGNLAVAFGVLLIGFAVMLTKFFIELVRTETALGRQVSIKEVREIGRETMPALIFPALIAVLAVLNTAMRVDTGTFLYAIDVLGMGIIMLSGFVSQFVVGKNVRFALARAVLWSVAGAVLTAAKALA